MSVFAALLTWSRHSLRLGASSAAAFFMASLPLTALSIAAELLDFEILISPAGGLAALLGILSIAVGFPIFAYMFTLFYTSSSWGWKANRDFKDQRGE